MVAWMIRALLVGGAISAAAYCFDSAGRNLRAPTRFAWLFGLLASIALPFTPRIIAAPSLPPLIPDFMMPELTTAASQAGSSAVTPDNVALALWLISSFMLFVLYGSAYASLVHARRAWRATEWRDVVASDQYGPAVFGFLHPRVVVPQWVLSATNEEKRLIMLHEHEHIVERDHLLILFATVATVFMPWNPFVWFQSRRLRLAVETDCDQRVLAAEPNAQRYASLLLNVGGRHAGWSLTSALAEHRLGLEKRIALIARAAARSRSRAVLFTIVGIILTVGATEARVVRDSAPRAINATGMNPEPRDTPYFTPYTRKPELTNRGEVSAALIRQYPPWLRMGGVGGTTLLWVFINSNGDVVETQLQKTSGHEALDVAAAKVALIMKFQPAENAGTPVDVWIQLPIVFQSNVVPPGTQLDPGTPADMSKPVFTPYTEKPELANRAEVLQALARNYPPLLRDAAIGGTTILWVRVTKDGVVDAARVKEPSDKPGLDQAALIVAKVMRFTPARNGNEKVTVWIQLPVVFKTGT
jgi:TonB family protein